jgi:hypothetical protein
MGVYLVSQLLLLLLLLLIRNLRECDLARASRGPGTGTVTPAESNMAGEIVANLPALRGGSWGNHTPNMTLFIHDTKSDD